ncbi:MAG TPA: fimbrillin family protein [Bacteroidales bacterium]|nr:fimbrillin family protein [Bacteroidales bacterium]
MKTKMKQIKEKTTKGNFLLSVLIAVVAIVFAACSSDVVLNDIAESQTDTPKAIGFTSFSEKITRADTDLEYYHNTFVVYGTKQSTVDNTIQYVFGGKATAAGNQEGVTCTYNATAGVTGNWEYVNPRYWDKQAEYDFIAYAPANAPLRYFYNAEDAQVGGANNEFVTNADYTLAGTNLQATATTAEKVKGFTGAGVDLDLMISNPKPQSGSNNADVALVFKHILSKLNVTFAKADVLDDATVTVTSVEITGLKEKGSYKQSDYVNDEFTKTSGWAAKEVTGSTYKLAYSNGQELNASDGLPYLFIESLVMPQTIDDDQVTLKAKYTIQTGGYSENYTYQLDLYDVEALRKYFDGYNYTLKFTIQPNVIKFDANVTVWDSQPASNQTIN